MKSGNGGDASESKGWPNVQTDFEKYKFNAYRDTSIKPGDDFFNYSLGNWVKTPNATGVWKITSYSDTSLYPYNTYNFQNSSEDDKGVMNNQETFGKKLAELVWNKYTNLSGKNIIKTLSSDGVLKFMMAGEVGVEPTQTVLETGILPLYYSPMRLFILS